MTMVGGSAYITIYMVRHAESPFVFGQERARGLSAKGLLDARRVAERANLSTEWFIQLFKRETGLTPKQYAGVIRFQRAVDHLRCKPEGDGQETELTCGYYDQSHFIRDFRLRTGMTPTEMLRRDDIVFNHVPVKTDQSPI
ncbi:helix-turn-helix domain-containing protein [Paenibacillus eucommiae]|uniref:AraC-like DNA-binding protein n=1 Tax=Paenibacillus eucommiae TaxID=1355755 RepID=A0ABS4J2V4_9BACL|nr:helix-turn-helix domain-containing protein [Paenibacillus eucommiae]MBP1994143.1 AraC-like DNA-binding protein [Paenibacillus eucommiae]